jgi:alpha-N-arabinofuranosidase
MMFWGIGNETWGCGGNMTPEYYSNIYKQLSTFCLGEFKILAGGVSGDLNWTEIIMKATSKKLDLIQRYSYHNYTICHEWMKKGAAVNENLNQHSAVMDLYDPEKKIAIIADEWGNWFDSEPGDNPSFLYQQNTLRDAVTAALYLNIFNNHCDRVKMSNIAQMVNVLQSVVLTKDNKIVLTPTYYVFKMYAVHQDATMLPIKLKTEEYTNGSDKINSLSVSASKDKEGKIHISITNLDPAKEKKLSCEVRGTSAKRVTGEIITAKSMNAYNVFGKPEEVTIKPYSGTQLQKGMLDVNLPAKSVIMLELD